MDLVDYTFISQNIDYNKNKFRTLYPCFNVLHEELPICESSFLGDVCFVITYLSDDRTDIINRLLRTCGARVHVYGPNSLLKQFPAQWPHDIYKGSVDICKYIFSIEI